MKNIRSVPSLLSGGSVEIEVSGEEDAVGSVQNMPVETLIAKTDFKNRLKLNEVTE